MYKLYCDGGSRNNPGEASCASFLFEDERLISFEGKKLGLVSNNVAEYEGLLLGMNLVLKMGVKDIICFLDSQLIVNQVNGIYKCKDANLSLYLKRVKESQLRFSSLSVKYIPREENKFPDKLVNIILDVYYLQKRSKDNI